MSTPTFTATTYPLTRTFTDGRRAGVTPEAASHAAHPLPLTISMKKNTLLNSARCSRSEAFAQRQSWLDDHRNTVGGFFPSPKSPPAKLWHPAGLPALTFTQRVDYQRRD